jgi:hypothetical protein
MTSRKPPRYVREPRPPDKKIKGNNKHQTYLIVTAREYIGKLRKQQDPPDHLTKFNDTSARLHGAGAWSSNDGHSASQESL